MIDFDSISKICEIASEVEEEATKKIFETTVRDLVGITLPGADMNLLKRVYEKLGKIDAVKYYKTTVPGIDLLSAKIFVEQMADSGGWTIPS